MTPLDKKKALILTTAQSAIQANGFYKLSTCDAANWDELAHIVMINMPATFFGLKISCNILHGVHDWTFVRDEQAKSVTTLEVHTNEFDNGPWCIEQRQSNMDAILDELDHIIAMVPRRNKANAKLIAVAPDMFKFLQLTYTTAVLAKKQDRFIDPDLLISVIEELINKATI